MKTIKKIGWVLIDVFCVIALIDDIATGKLTMDIWLKIVLVSLVVGMLVVAIVRKYVQKERERTRAPKKSE